MAETDPIFDRLGALEIELKVQGVIENRLKTDFENDRIDRARENAEIAVKFEKVSENIDDKLENLDVKLFGKDGMFGEVFAQLRRHEKALNLAIGALFLLQLAIGLWIHSR